MKKSNLIKIEIICIIVASILLLSFIIGKQKIEEINKIRIQQLDSSQNNFITTEEHLQQLAKIDNKLVIPRIYAASNQNNTNPYAGGGGTQFENVKSVNIENLVISGPSQSVTASSWFRICGYKNNVTTVIVRYDGATNLDNLSYDVSDYDSIEIYCYSYNGTTVNAKNVTIEFKSM